MQGHVQSAESRSRPKKTTEIKQDDGQHARFNFVYVKVSFRCGNKVAMAALEEISLNINAFRSD